MRAYKLRCDGGSTVTVQGNMSYGFTAKFEEGSIFTSMDSMYYVAYLFNVSIFKDNENDFIVYEFVDGDWIISRSLKDHFNDKMSNTVHEISHIS